MRSHITSFTDGGKINHMDQCCKLFLSLFIATGSVLVFCLFVYLLFFKGQGTFSSA